MGLCALPPPRVLVPFLLAKNHPINPLNSMWIQLTRELSGCSCQSSIFAQGLRGNPIDNLSEKNYVLKKTTQPRIEDLGSLSATPLTLGSRISSKKKPDIKHKPWSLEPVQTSVVELQEKCSHMHAPKEKHAFIHE